MKLYNTLSRQIETVNKTPEFSMYTCGPTVYNKLHIGNWVAYIRWDVLARTLRANGFKIKWIMNITDVGHLVSDADEGEDKLEKGAKREGKTAWQIADIYTKDFTGGIEHLNIDIDPRNLVRATDHIKEQLNLIKVLEKKGYTYVIDDGVYFDTSKFKNYSLLAKLSLDNQKAGVRVVENKQKLNPSDFALWKFSPKNKTRDMEWDSPWGRGFPGWHLECSAMAMKYLGSTIDLHAGGIDHIPIHHTNEIAQSEAATGKQFARIWVHGNFLTINGTKISKSLENDITLDDLNTKGFGPLDFRMFVLQSHYQTESNFTYEALQAAAQRLKIFQMAADMRFQANEKSTIWLNKSGVINDSLNALSNNLNSPQALKTVHMFFDQVIDEGINKSELELYNEILLELDDLLGLKLTISKEVSANIKELLKQRLSARQSKNWAEADKIRASLNARGIGVRDSKTDQFWYYL
ncbi:MAG: cysteine--tRNA ligase [Patescibacteria group bacterium]